MRRPRSRRVGDDEERRQRGFLPDFRETIKAARGPREGVTGSERHEPRNIWRAPAFIRDMALGSNRDAGQQR
jgi:hypothetical protein